MTATASPTGPPAYRETLPRTAQSVAVARRLVRTALLAWSLDVLADDGAVVVSELAANAVRYATGHSMRITVTRVAPERVRIGVADGSRKFPVPDGLEADEDGTRGRGLAVIGRLATDWGAEPLPRGKQVWAELGPRAIPLSSVPAPVPQ